MPQEEKSKKTSHKKMDKIKEAESLFQGQEHIKEAKWIKHLHIHVVKEGEPTKNIRVPKRQLALFKAILNQ